MKINSKMSTHSMAICDHAGTSFTVGGNGTIVRHTRAGFIGSSRARSRR
ncbi:uncharacterized protein SOCE26_074450 [Sorangium cellulosum]|uniref:Uncharacterized protein n=1 Tax=Sorangium cellulosum TaxID=56 RepID=A0A2L0F335_SORCE|nr:uncharacterized protein SOCE26_074450 [Sorangium cellulosum]